jgi:hypothetical protein
VSGSSGEWLVARLRATLELSYRALQTMSQHPPSSPKISSFCEKDVSGLPSTSQQNASHHHDIPTQGSYIGASTGSILARHQSIADARSLADIDRPSTESDVTFTGSPKIIYRPFSPAVIALLMPTSVLGTLARLGLQSLATYDGKSIFPLAYPQALGCLIMGIVLPLKVPINN